VEDAHLLALADRGGATDISLDPGGQLPLLDGKSDGPAKQADADQGDFLPGHTRSMSGRLRLVKNDVAIKGPRCKARGPCTTDGR
jgi:hypothetical protein